MAAPSSSHLIVRRLDLYWFLHLLLGLGGGHVLVGDVLVHRQQHRVDPCYLTQGGAACGEGNGANSRVLAGDDLRW
jgi:hypothetical protein